MLSHLILQDMISKIKSLYSLFHTFRGLSFFLCLLLLKSNTSPSWSPAAVGVSTCQSPSSSAAGWGGRGQWRSDAGPSFSGVAWRTTAESLGGLASAAAPESEAPSPEAARWASRSAGLDGLDEWQRQGGQINDTGCENVSESWQQLHI